MIQNVWFYTLFIRFLFPKPLLEGGAVFFAVLIFSTVPLLSEARTYLRQVRITREGHCMLFPPDPSSDPEKNIHW
jgi:hypothetical protein